MRQPQQFEQYHLKHRLKWAEGKQKLEVLLQVCHDIITCLVWEGLNVGKVANTPSFPPVGGLQC